MGFGTVLSAAVFGLKVEFVNVEADVSNGLPMFHMVGYLSSEVKEATDRVRTAIHNSGMEFPAKKTIINLAPATIKKRGAAFDLPIATAILTALGQLKTESVKNIIMLGELSLDGKVKAVTGVLPVVLAAKERGIRTCILPKANALEGALVEKMQIIGVDNLEETISFLNQTKEIRPVTTQNRKKEHQNGGAQLDFCDVYGQAAVKRATEIAVAGNHNLLLIGPPGSAKSMIAKRIPTIFPEMTMKESIEITKIYSILGMLEESHPLICTRPFRSVHHTATKAALIGGGRIPRPGEISLAHSGVLFLDELPEFQREVLEVLRQPLEEHQIRITRAQGTYQFPANFMLVGALNPCPCGCYPDLNKCRCTEREIQQYIGKLSQPFLDRMDICVEAPRVEYEVLKEKREEETSEEIRKRVSKARKIQQKRYQNMGILTNAQLEGKQLEQYCGLGQKEERMMRQAFLKLGLTARTYYKILKVARTIADLGDSETIEIEHLQEAIGYRTMDKKYWGK